MKRAFLRLKGQLYKARVQSVLVYGSETLAMMMNDIRRLDWGENTMLRWMCGVILRDTKQTALFMNCLGVVSVNEVANRG